RSIRELTRTISEPHKELVRGFETVEVRLRNGSQLRGIRKNEDTFSLQVMDESEKLHLLSRKDVAAVRLTGKSLMPEGAVSGAQLNDVIAFLANAPASQPTASAQTSDGVTYERLKASAKEPQNWLSYWGDLRGTHYSGLSSITPGNVRSLTGAW